MRYDLITFYLRGTSLWCSQNLVWGCVHNANMIMTSYWLHHTIIVHVNSPWLQRLNIRTFQYSHHYFSERTHAIKQYVTSRTCICTLTRASHVWVRGRHKYKLVDTMWVHWSIHEVRVNQGIWGIILKWGYPLSCSTRSAIVTCVLTHCLGLQCTSTIDGGSHPLPVLYAFRASTSGCPIIDNFL